VDKLGIVLMIVNFFAALGCKDSTTIADEIPVDDDTGSDLQLDSSLDSSSQEADCEAKTAVPGDMVRTIQVGGDLRTYVLHIPSAYSGSTLVPLIVDYHGIGDSGAKERADSPYPQVTDLEGVVTAFPDGLEGPSGTAWNIGPCCVDDVDDVAFTRSMVTDIESVACIDPARIYAVGISLGGAMAYHIACQAADVFAAVAPAAADMVEETAPECAPARPISVISFRGTNEPLVPYEGGYTDLIPGHPMTFFGALNTFELWVRLDECTGVASDVGNGCQLYAESQCRGGVEVMLCTKQGGGTEYGDPTIAWPILKRHLLR
jgi:poly(3-hydroxybutyrate) depolymerase